jgi:hypothetical protein
MQVHIPIFIVRLYAGTVLIRSRTPTFEDKLESYYMIVQCSIAIVPSMRTVPVCAPFCTRAEYSRA